ncbi:MAG: NAD(P)/FAD-dependent oxidoreductase [Verrucomicrobiales bacterium]
MAEKPILIVGAGIAGVLIAWSLTRHGKNVVLVDDERPGRASPVAVGLVNPIAGLRLNCAAYYEQYLSSAHETYAQFSEIVGRPIFQSMDARRFFRDPFEWQQVLKHQNDPAWNKWVVSKQAPDGDQLGSLTMRGGGWIDFPAILSMPKKLGWPQRTATFRLSDWDAQTCCWKAEPFEALILAQGYDPLLDWPWNPAAGDALRVRMVGWSDDMICSRGIFTVPIAQDQYRVGSTYVWDDLSAQPQAERAKKLLAQLQSWTKQPAELLEHRVGVRPIMKSKRPMAGPLQGLQHVYALNGLGSKGGLWAPHLAKLLTSVILAKNPEDALHPFADPMPCA